MNNEEIAHLETMIDLHTKNLYALEEMLATYGANQPQHLLDGVTMEREAIARYSEQLEGLGERCREREKSKLLAYLPRRTIFVGWENEINSVLQSLHPNSRTFLIGIEGVEGVGKSALAIEVSHRCLEDELFEAVIWTSAKESTWTLPGTESIIPAAKSLSDILVTIGTILGNDTIDGLPIQDQIKKAYQLLARQTTLLVLDNFESFSKTERAGILDFLRRSPITLKIIVTSRNQIPAGQIIRLQRPSFAEDTASLGMDT